MHDKMLYLLFFPNFCPCHRRNLVMLSTGSKQMLLKEKVCLHWALVLLKKSWCLKQIIQGGNYFRRKLVLPQPILLQSSQLLGVLERSPAAKPLSFLVGLYWATLSSCFQYCIINDNVLFASLSMTMTVENDQPMPTHVIAFLLYDHVQNKKWTPAPASSILTFS